VARTLPLLDDRQKMLGNQLEGLISFNTGSVRHEALLGLELLRFTDVFDLRPALLPGIDLENPVETAREPLFIVDFARQQGDARSTVVAPYLVDPSPSATRSSSSWVAADVLDRIPVSAASRDDSELSPGACLLRSSSLYASAGGLRAALDPGGGDRAREEPPDRAGVKKALSGSLRPAVLPPGKDDVAILDSTG
jgi:iron complex outermembrane receptor protein